MKRRVVFKLSLFLLAGAIVNVAVAWGCALWSVGAELYDIDWPDIRAPHVSARECAWLKGFESQLDADFLEDDWSFGDLAAFGFHRRDYFSLPRRNFEPEP